MSLFTKKLADWSLLDAIKLTGILVGSGWAVCKYLEHKETDNTTISEDEYENDETTETVESEPWEKS